MFTLRMFVAPFGAVAFFACTGAMAAPDCSTVPAITPLQKRIAARAAEGLDELRRFVTLRQVIYQFDVHATMEQGVRHHEWLVHCGRAAADGAAVDKTVAKTDR